MGEAEQAFAGWRPGAVVLDVYAVGESLGAGGMGEVHRVHHLGWDTDLAVKSLHEELRRDEDALEAVMAEARTWIGLPPHPNVCSCFYVRVIDGIPRLFSEFAEDGSLLQALRSGRCATVAEVLDVAIQTARGIAVAHGAGVVHQDVKPGNVLLAADGRAMLTDFGLAGVWAKTDPQGSAPLLATAHGMTVPYASPEQLAGRRLGPASDVYSWAASVLQTFLGRRTWSSGPSAGSALDAVLGSGPPPGRPAVPAAVADLLRACLAPHPGDRPADLWDLAARLAAAYEHQTGRPYPRADVRAVAQRADGLNNKALSLLDLGLADQASAAWADALREDRRHPDSVYNAALTRWRDRARSTDDDVDVLAALEDMRTAQPDTSGHAEHLVMLAQLERGDVRAADALRVDAARWAPGGTDHAHAAAHIEHGLRLPPLRIDALTAPGYTVTALAITPDGRWAAAARARLGVTPVDGPDHEVGVWDLATGSRVATVPADEHLVGRVVLSADGRHLVTAPRFVERGITQWWRLTPGNGGDSEVVLLRAVAPPTAVTVTAVTTTGDGDARALVARRGSAGWWDLGATKRLRRLRHPLLDRIAAVAVTPDGTTALTGGDVVRCWELTTGRLVREWRATGTRFVALTPDAGHALTAGAGGVVLWDLRTGEPVTRAHVRPRDERDRPSVSGPYEGVQALAVDRDARWFVVGTGDGTVAWFDRGGRPVRTERMPLAVTTLWVEQGDGAEGAGGAGGAGGARRVVAACPSGEIAQWLHHPSPAPLALSRTDSAAATVAHEERFRRTLADDRDGLTGEVDALRTARSVPGFARDPDLVARWRTVGRRGHRTRFLDSALVGELRMSDQMIMSLQLDADGEHVVVVTRSHTGSGLGPPHLRFWHVADRRELWSRPVPEAHTCAVARDAGLIAVSGSPATLWTVRGERVGELRAGRHLAGILRISDDGRHVLARDSGRALVRLTLRDGTARDVVRLGARRAAMTGSGELVIARAGEGDRGGPVRGATVRTLRADDPTGVPDHLLVADDARLGLTIGGYSVSYGGRGTAGVWDLTTGELLCRPDHGFGAPVALAADGRHLLACRHHTTVALYDVRRGTRLRVLSTVGATLVALTPDARYAAVGSPGTVTVWALDWDYAFPDDGAHSDQL